MSTSNPAFPASPEAPIYESEYGDDTAGMITEDGQHRHDPNVVSDDDEKIVGEHPRKDHDHDASSSPPNKLSKETARTTLSDNEDAHVKAKAHSSTPSQQLPKQSLAKESPPNAKILADDDDHSCSGVSATSYTSNDGTSESNHQPSPDHPRESSSATSWVGDLIEVPAKPVKRRVPKMERQEVKHRLDDLVEVPKKAIFERRKSIYKRFSLVGSFMESFNTEVAYAHLKSKDAVYFKDCVGWSAIVLLTVAYAMARFVSRKFRHEGMHVSTAIWILFGGYTFLRRKFRVLVSDADRTLYLANVVVSTAIGLLLIVFFETSCIHCAFYVVEESSEGGIGLMDAAEFLLVEADELDRKTLACQACTSAFFSFFFYFTESPVVAFSEENDAHKLEGMEHITDIVSLAHSIDELNDRKKTADSKSFQQKILYEVAQNGHLDIGEAFGSYLCSPSSRVVGDTSVEFLDRIQSPRFSGESINLTVAQMSSIMRGDILKDLGVAACFILRFALFVPENPAIDHIKMESGAPPIMNEEKMKVLDATADIPGLVIPQIDPEVDRQGVAIMLTKSLMDAYVKFPFNNEPIYFNTRDEYYFFYRWNMELSIQDEWYFPNWLLKERTRDKMIDVMSKRNTLAMDIVAFDNPTSDETLSDRVFYGTGQKFLTPIKLPGNPYP